MKNKINRYISQCLRRKYEEIPLYISDNGKLRMSMSGGADFKKLSSSLHMAYREELISVLEDGKRR